MPLPLDLLPSFWKSLVGEPLDPDQDLQEADILTYNYVKKFESVSEGTPALPAPWEGTGPREHEPGTPSLPGLVSWGTTAGCR